MPGAIEVRAIAPDELRDWVRVAHIAFHAAHSPDEETAMRRELVGQPTERTLGAFEHGQLVGTLHTFETPLTLPGGGTLTADAITSASVLPTHRRRGILRQLLTCDLSAARVRGERATILISAEYPIYGRFGYGPATYSSVYTLEARAAFTHQATGSVELISQVDMRTLAPRLFERFRTSRAGQIGRSDTSWESRLGIRPWPWSEHPPDRFAIYKDTSGEVHGYLTYHVESNWERRVPRGTLEIDELVALTPDAYLGLWQYCSQVDLVASVHSGMRPPDEPLPWLLDNPRASWRELDRADFLWLRPLVLAACLESRTYGCEGELAFEVSDPLGLCSGRVLLQGGPDGARCTSTTRAADVNMSVDALGTLLLGHAAWHSLEQAGRIEEHTPGTLKLAATMFHTGEAPWCSTFF